MKATEPTNTLFRFVSLMVILTLLSVPFAADVRAAPAEPSSPPDLDEALLTLLPAWAELLSPAPVQADAVQTPTAPTAPVTLPSPFLSDGHVVDAPFDNPPSPAVDGLISPGEYAGAGKVTFPGYGGDVEVFFKHDAANLYVAFELPDQANTMPYASLLLDTDNDGSSAPQTDDFEFRVLRDGNVWEYQGNGITWQQNTPITWTYGLTETMSGWSIEFGIPFTKLGLTAAAFKELGLAMDNWDAGPAHLWPAGAMSSQPGTWGSLISSSDWGTFYWKPGPWEDYATSGMPDFDQNQDIWVGYDGPATVANSLWWFDSKFEPEPAPPTIITDHYRLVTSYGAWDDHYYSNTVPLVDDLATNYLGTNYGINGTHPISMFHGVHNYLRDPRRGLWDDYIVTMVMSPTFEWVTDEVMRSEDVILLMGLYEDQDPDPTVERWVRVGGHYVNVAGVDPVVGQIAFSDPLVDFAEQGWRPGRVLSGTLLPHTPIPHYTTTLHNDAGNVSHDVYTVTLTDSPGGTWGPERYSYLWDDGGGRWILDESFWMIIGQNPHPIIEMGVPLTPTENLIQTEVELAIAVSPYTWKSSGEWLSEGDDPVMGYWQQWDDYAPNGVPDFDQKQDCWGTMPCPPTPPAKYTFCGPVAAANSLWWFDSKFEPTPVLPPVSNDNYPLVGSYDPLGTWDDHDPLNVDDPATPWMGPGSAGEFIEDLATYFQTDVGNNGTHIVDMYTGIDQYIIDRGLRQGYVITMAESPDFWWVAEEVEVSEDVILLLGFWEKITPGEYQRVGGHYVTVPGVDKQGGLVAFSDPWYDGAEYAWPYAYPAGWPTALGRVADGVQPGYTHIPKPHTVYTLHNDAGNVSHDVYYVTATDSPGGVWGPQEYVEGGIPETNFLEQNGDIVPYGGGLVQAEVDYALAVSPVADVSIAKGVNTSTVRSGDWLTFTLRFRNDGSLPAEDVVITDVLDPLLVNPAWDYWTSNGLSVTVRAGDTYAWELPDLAWMEWGLITITAQISPTLNPMVPTIITNTASISTTTIEQYQVAELANMSEVTVTVRPMAFQWDKTVNGVDWSGLLTLLVETSDVITVVDAVSSTAPFTLTEVWDPANISLVTYTLVPPLGVGSVVTGPDRLVWTEPGGAFTLTKLFRVEPCTWTQTLLTETVGINGQLWQRPVIFDKQSPVLQITSVYTPQVYVGQPATFTLHYTNSGGYENDVWLLNRFPISAPIASAVPAPTISATNGITALWRVGDMANGVGGNIVVTVAITDAVAYPDTLDIWDGIYDHTDALADEVTTTFEVQPTGCISITGVDFDWMPYYPDAGEVVTFTVISIQPLNATPPFTYQWGFGDGSSAWGDPVTHTYAFSGVYTVYITATNPCGGPVWMSHSITVTGEPDIGVTPLALSAALDPDAAATHPLTVSNAATATANLNWSLAENPNVSWLSATPPTGTVAPGGGDVPSVTFDATGMTPGVYTTALEISSNDPDESQLTVPVTLTVNCVAVTSVTLSITNTGAIYTDTVIHFSTDLAPDTCTKPYSYYISVNGGLSVVFTDTADPLLWTDTFGVTGTYTVEFGAQNCAMTAFVTDVITFTVREQGACVDLTSITIHGAISGTPGSYTFTTDYDPWDASPPISYTWENGDTADTSVRSLGVGTHTLMVTATNCTSALVTDVHEIVITTAPVCTEVTGVNLTITNTGTIYTDTVVHFSADVAPDDADKPYTYTIDYGSGHGTPVSSGDDPLTFDNTFVTTGTHTVEVAVWNCAMTSAVTDDVSFTVREQEVCINLDSITIGGATSGTPGSYTFTASYEPFDASIPITYAWDNGDTTATSIRTLSVGTTTLVVTATNMCTTVPVTDTHDIVVSSVGYDIYLPLVVRNS